VFLELLEVKRVARRPGTTVCKGSEMWNEMSKKPSRLKCDNFETLACLSQFTYTRCAPNIYREWEARKNFKCFVSLKKFNDNN
jgi:hypothetical protein